MLLDFEELDYQQTPLGDISLRRRAEPRLDGKILYEVKLGDEFLMSSLFTEAEVQLARLGLAELDGSELDVVVGGLGLGYTAVAVLENPSVRSLNVIEVMAPVIDWHRRGLVPLGSQLTSDPRCSLVHGDFFDLATSSSNGFDSSDSNKLVHAVLLDIDHSPRILRKPISCIYSIVCSSLHSLTLSISRILTWGVSRPTRFTWPAKDFNAGLIVSGARFNI